MSNLKISKILMLLISVILFTTFINTSAKGIQNVNAEGVITVWNGTSDTSWYDDTNTTFNIENAEDLSGLATLVNNGNTFSGKTIVLANDILLNDDTTTNAWTPIGNAINKFLGTFDGQKHVISGLAINNSNDYQGLFGYNEGTIKSIVISGAISAVNHLGSIVGYNKGTVYNTGSSVTIISTKTSDTLNVGGIAGTNEGTIVNSYFNGSVSASGSAAEINIGGIAGINVANSKIDNCYNIGALSGTSSASTFAINIGGISGTSSGEVTNCYAKSPNHVVNGSSTSSCATFVDNTGTLTAEVAGTLNYGVNLRKALNSRINRIDEIYTDLQGWVDDTANDGYPTLNKGVTLTGNWSDPGNYDTSWYFENPHLLVYNIGTAEQLAGLAVLVNGTDTSGTGYYETKKNSTEPKYVTRTIRHNELVSFHTKIVNIEKDIVLNGDSMTREWTPIGDYDTGVKSLVITEGSDNQPNTIPAGNKIFAGTFSGSDGVISKMYINNPTGNYQGLFGLCFYSVASVNSATGPRDQYNNAQNLSVSGEVTGNRNVGGIFGINFRMAFCVDFSGSVVGHTNVGGISGYSDRAIRNSFNSATVTGYEFVGGLSGYCATGATRNSYNTGDVIGNNYVGGIVGRSSSAKVDNCYNIGNVTGNTNVYGVANLNAERSYFLKNDTINTNVPTGDAATFTSADNDAVLSRTVYVGGRSCTTLYEALKAFFETAGSDTVDLVPWIRDDGTPQVNQGYPIFGGTLDVVYVRDKPSGYKGNYTGDSVQNSVSTIALGYDKLKPGGTIVICGPLTKETIMTFHQIDATITSKITVNGTTIDYRNNLSNSALNGGNASWTIKYNTTFVGNTKLQDLTIKPHYNMIMFGSGFELWLSTGITIDTTHGALNIVGGAVQSDVNETNVIIESGNYQVVCGGGYYDEYNSVSSVIGDTHITITGGTFGDIYGAGRHCDVQGIANIYIGSSANPTLVSSHNLQTSDIIVHGSVVGGAVLPEGSLDDAVTSTIASNLNINGTGYRAASNTSSSLPVLTITRNVIGFNTGSSTTGTTNIINIINYGTPEYPMVLSSIQRANSLVITNSAIRLLGSNDVNDLYSGNSYSFSRIGLNKSALGYTDDGLMMRDSTLICSAPFNMVMRMQSQDIDGELYDDNQAQTITKNYIYMRTGTILELSMIESSVTGSFSVYGEVKGIFILDVLSSEIDPGTQAKNIYVIAQSSVYIDSLGYSANYAYCNFYSVNLANGFLQEYTDSHYREVQFARAMYDYWEMVPLAYGITEITLLVHPDGTTTESVSLPITPENTVWRFNKLTISSGFDLVPDGSAITDANKNKQFELKVHASTADQWKEAIDFNITGNSQNPTVNFPQSNLISNGNVAHLNFTLSHHASIDDIGVVGIVSLEIINPASGDIINYVITIKTSNYAGAPSAVTIRTDFKRRYDMIAAGYTSISIVANSIFSLQITDTYTASSTTLHRLVTSTSLPAGTRITLIDCTTVQSKYYYYVVPSDSSNIIDFTSFSQMGTNTPFAEPANGPVTGETYILNFDFTRVTNSNKESIGKQIDFRFLIGELDHINSCYAGMVSINFIADEHNSGTIDTSITGPIDIPEASDVIEIPFEIDYSVVDTVTSIIMVVELEQNGLPYQIPEGAWIEVFDSLGNNYLTYGRGDSVYADMYLPTDLLGKVVIHGLTNVDSEYDIIMNICAIEHDSTTQDKIAFPMQGLLTGSAPVKVSTTVHKNDTHGVLVEYTTDNPNDRVIIASDATNITYKFALKYETSCGKVATFLTDVYKKDGLPNITYSLLSETGKWKQFNTSSTDISWNADKTATFTCGFKEIPDPGVYRIVFIVKIHTKTFEIPFNLIVI